MVDPNAYIEDGLKIVNKLASRGDLQSAFRACMELLKINPYHRKTEKLLKKIEQLIIEENEKKVSADIDATMPLWSQKRYDELLKIYTKLYSYAPNHKRLKKMLQKLSEKMSSAQKNERKTFITAAIAGIERLIKEKKIGDAIQACNELLDVDPLNKMAAELLLKTKDELIDQKLRENARISESADFQRALEFYESLLNINPNNEHVKRLKLQVQSHLAEQRLLSTRIHFNESLQRMKDMFKNSEYEKVLVACEEIQREDPDNITAKIFKRKARKIIQKEFNLQTIKHLKEALVQTKKEYAQNPQAFVKT